MKEHVPTGRDAARGRRRPANRRRQSAALPDGETRTAQFLIERRCPQGWHPDPSVRMNPPEWPLLPICVWVELYGLPLLCGGKTFRIVRDRGAVSTDGKHYDFDMDRVAPHVCDHMGQIIE